MARSKSFLIYGATGYTGKLSARHAKSLGLQPILAGRNEAKLRSLASELDLEFRTFDLSDKLSLDKTLSEVAAVVHMAGPFSATSKPMADGCLRTNTHYLDITGEIEVFESLAARDAEARMAGVMVLPGVGFDVVPSDCLAAHVKRRLPDAEDLKIYIGGNSSASRGTIKTMIEGIAKGTLVRRGGVIEAIDGLHEDSCDFGNGPRPTIAVSWGDVSTAFYSTKIPNIEVHFEAQPELQRVVKLPSMVKAFLGFSFMQSFLKRQVDRLPEGPNDTQRQAGHAVLIAVARNSRGGIVRSRLRTPEGYSLTALSAVELANRAANGEFKVGFQTPSLAFGPDFVTQFSNVSRQDLNQ